MAAVVALLALTGCASVAGADAASTPNTSPATHISGPIDISTDHSIYAPTEVINVTITNSLSKPIIAYDTQSGCSILALQRQQSGQWVVANEAHCPMGRVAAPITIKAGGVYHAAIHAGFSGVPSGGGQQYFTPGVYRLALEYFLAPLGSNGSHNPTNGILLLSASFSVVGAVPATTAPASGGKGGTTIIIAPAGTVTGTR
ncbi:MAG: hypothetical protein ABI068_13325 [Ktedonobacterales bacterium]